MNRPQFLLAALLSIACLLAGGCPTDTSGGDATSNSNTNSDTGTTDANHTVTGLSIRKPRAITKYHQAAIQTSTYQCHSAANR